VVAKKVAKKKGNLAAATSVGLGQSAAAATETDKCATGASPSFAPVPQDGDKPVIAPVEPAH
jgi:hypothetical protein